MTDHTEIRAVPIWNDRPDGSAEPAAQVTTGMRIRHVRLRSALKLASTFFALGFLVAVGTAVALWNVALRIGFVEDIERLMTTSLGLESFELSGDGLFDLLLITAGLGAVLGLAFTMMLALVYNAACSVFGGLAVETGPLRRAKRVFSIRERRFVSVR